MIKEVEKSSGKHNMYRSLGRMFVLVSPEELSADLAEDMKKIDTENERSAEMLKNLQDKKDQLTTALNGMTPKEQQ